MGGAPKTSRAFRQVLKAEGKVVDRRNYQEDDDEDNESNASTAGDVVEDHMGDGLNEVNLSFKDDEYEESSVNEKISPNSNISEVEGGLDWLAASAPMSGNEEQTSGGLADAVLSLKVSDEGLEVKKADEIEKGSEYDLCFDSKGGGKSEKYDYCEDVAGERGH